MDLFKLFLGLMGLFVLLVLGRALLTYSRFRRRYSSSSERSEARMQQFLATAATETKTESPSVTPQHLAKELKVLQAMCTSPPESGIHALGVSLLRDYEFQKTSHQIVFDILGELPAAIPELIREQLPARLTRKGFPDVDIEPFLVPVSLSVEEAKELMQSLQENS